MSQTAITEPSNAYQFIETGFIARPLQNELHNRMRRFNVIVCHRRFGKTVLAINELIDGCFKCIHPYARFAYIAPYRNQAKDIAWSYIKRYAQNIPGTKVNESDLKVTFANNAVISILGADNPDRLRGTYLDGVVLDEYGDMQVDIWDKVIRPQLVDRLGWAIFIGTPKGFNHFWRAYESASIGFLQADGSRLIDHDWFSAIYRASETNIIPKAELVAQRNTLTPEHYEQEWECSFQAGIVGAVYGRELKQADEDKRIGKVLWEETSPVYTAWDLGVSDTCAIWFAQIFGREIHIIDYYENFGYGYDHYVKVLLQNKPYLYAQHILPHDIEPREKSNGISGLTTIKKLGLKNVKVLEKTVSIDADITHARLTFRRCRFDADKAGKGIDALRNYIYEYSQKNGSWSTKPKERHWANHGADAFRYLCIGLTGEPYTNKINPMQMNFETNRSL